ncbi:MAG TPA: NAD-dependent deacetylase [Gammaproteobacteria bacterium]|nr:NAD-dependent deacetylase [Gammaproteobacteria bacterium]|tara:strand:- start:761 stop:1546 length:786 start_codon:yes stop_codon:yes gene_type:complete
MSESNSSTKQLEEARCWLSTAQRILVLTGAGLSTGSGIPDFRGPQGIWTRDPDAEKLSDIHYYVSDENIRRKAWLSRRDSPVWQACPGLGHEVLARFEQSGRLDTLVTQNIDGLHQLAGSSRERVIEIHGTIREVVCLVCSYRVPMQDVLKRLAAGEEDPKCPDCGGILKSATVSFGQSLIAQDLARAEQAARDCDLMLAVGSMLSVYPVAGLVPIAKESGARIVIVNGEPTAMDGIADAVLLGDLDEVLPGVLDGTHIND